MATALGCAALVWHVTTAPPTPTAPAPAVKHEGWIALWVYPDDGTTLGVSWEPLVIPPSNTTGLRIERSLNGTDWVEVEVIDGVESGGFLNGALLPGTEYFYRVQALT